VLVPQILENMLVQSIEFRLYPRVIGKCAGAFGFKYLLASADILDFSCQVIDLIHFALATILCCHLVLAATTYVTDERELCLAQLVLGQALIEFIHR